MQNPMEVLALFLFSSLINRNFISIFFLIFANESYLTNGYLDTVIDWIPRMRSIHLSDLPTFLQTTDPNDVIFNFLLEVVERATKALGLVIQTFNMLEQEVLDALSTMFPQAYVIGPLQPLVNHSPNDPLKSSGYSLWKEEVECLQWLNSKAPNSMIYMNFGIIRAFTSEILKKLYFTTSKPTLPILPSYFTTHPTSQFLFLYTAH